MWLQAASLSYLGIFFGISVVIGLSCGSYLDNRFHTTPVLRIVGVLFGLATGFNELYRIAKRYQRQQKAAADAADSPAQTPLLNEPIQPAAPSAGPGSKTDDDRDKEAREKEEQEKAEQDDEERRRKDAWV